VTPHASTGYSPYFLLYGRDPYLPINFLLGRNSATTTDINYDRWIEFHSKKLKFAYDRAKSEIQRDEDDRKQRHDERKTENELQIGDQAYIRNRGVKGRDKIQDKWKSEVYTIVDKPCNSVYSVKRANSDLTGVKNVNRLGLKPIFK
jgi:hypothetical protein